MPTVDDDRVLIGLLLLGARLRERRVRAGLQLADVAERSGTSMTHLSEVERGRKMPSLATLDAIAHALDTSVAALLRGVYPWGSAQPPAEPPGPPADGRAGRKIRGRSTGGRQ